MRLSMFHYIEHERNARKKSRERERKKKSNSCSIMKSEAQYVTNKSESYKKKKKTTDHEIIRIKRFLSKIEEYQIGLFIQ
jgi:hypothetical protein